MKKSVFSLSFFHSVLLYFNPFLTLYFNPINLSLRLFLHAHVFKRLYPSVGPSVHPSVSLSVRWSGPGTADHNTLFRVIDFAFSADRGYLFYVFFTFSIFFYLSLCLPFFLFFSSFLPFFLSFFLSDKG